MPGTGVRIALTRHGETEWNVEGRWQGQSDSALTPRGLQQAQKLADALAGDPLAAVYSSDLGRAFETARLVAESHGLSVTPDPRLREIDAGLWTSRLGTDIRREYPAQLDDWHQRPWSLRMPGGETLAEAQARALAFFAERMPRHLGQSVAVITHGAITQAILAAAMGRPLTDIWLKEGRIENCQVSRLEWTPDHGLRLLEFADVRHLETVGALGSWRFLPADHPREGDEA